MGLYTIMMLSTPNKKEDTDIIFEYHDSTIKKFNRRNYKNDWIPPIDDYYTSLTDYLMKGVLPIGTSIEIIDGAPSYHINDLENPVNSEFTNMENINRIVGSAVYLDKEGKIILADSNYKIIECNGMNFKHIGYAPLNDFSTHEQDFECIYFKESVYSTDEKRDI